MSRAEYKRQAREGQKKEARYYVTKAQLQQMVKDEYQGLIDEAVKRATDEAINVAMSLALTIPIDVLMEDYWSKSAKKRIPGFAEKVVDKFDQWQRGEYDLEAARERLYENGHVKLEVY